MGGAMLSGWLESGLAAANISVLDPKPSTAMMARMKTAGVRHFEKPSSDYTPDIIILAVKPQIMEAVLPTLASLVSSKCVVVSVAAGKTIASIEKHFGEIAVVRAMPNTPALLRRGMTVGCPNERVSGEQRLQIEYLLSAIGKFEWVEDEKQIDAVTAVSGSGPAYVFHMCEAMTAAGVEAGLPKQLADQLARETIAGAGEMLSKMDEEASVLRENVTSPNGTTAAGLSVLMDNPGLKEMMVAAILKAKKRSEELS